MESCTQKSTTGDTYRALVNCSLALVTAIAGSSLGFLLAAAAEVWGSCAY